MQEPQLAVRRRLTKKGLDVLAPETVPVPDSPDDDSLTDALESSPPETRHQPDANPASLLRLMVPRASNHKDVLLSASWIGKKKTWRWQIRSSPALSGTERSHPAQSLSAFFATHKLQLAEGAEHLISERIAALEQHPAHVFCPAGARRLRADVAKLDLPSAPNISMQTAVHAHSLTWDDLIALAAKPLSTERCLPPTVNSLLSEVIRALLQNLQADQGAPTAALVYVLPKLCWPSYAIRPQGRAPKGRQRQRLISMRLQAVLQGQAYLLFHEAMQQPDAMPTHIVDDEPMRADDPALVQQEAAKLFKHVSRGEQCAALKRLRAPPIAPPTKASWDAAWAKLNPESSPDPICAGPSPAWRPEAKHWTTTVERLRPGKALDPGGWSHEIIQQAWMNAATAQRIRDWLEAFFARASVPEAQLMQMHRSVLLTKPNSSSIRPI